MGRKFQAPRRNALRGGVAVTVIETISLTVVTVGVGFMLLIASPMPRFKPDPPPATDEKQPAREVIIESQDLRPDVHRVLPLPQVPLDDEITPEAQAALTTIEQRVQNIVARTKRIEAKIDEPAKK